MSLKGGYQIINLRNREFNSEMGNSERYPDIYFNMVNSHAKMIIISGLNMDGVKYNDYEVIFHEEKPEGEDMYFQAIARRIWDTKNYKCITKFINIFSDDRVTCTQNEFIYEILPDSKLSLTSTNALQNKIITQNINRIDSVNERQDNDISNNSTEISKHKQAIEANARANVKNSTEISNIKKVRTLSEVSDAKFINSMGEGIDISPIRFSQEGYCDSMGNVVIKIIHIEGIGEVNFHAVAIKFSDNEDYQLGRKFDGIISIRSFAMDVSQEKVYRVEGKPSNIFPGAFAIGYPLELDSYNIQVGSSGSYSPNGRSWITIIGKFHD